MKTLQRFDSDRALGGQSCLQLSIRPRHAAQKVDPGSWENRTAPFVLIQSVHGRTIGPRNSRPASPPSRLHIWIVVTVCFLNASVAWGEESPARSYTLQEVITLALNNHPNIQISHGVIEEKQGEQVSVDSYHNPSITLQSGRGQVLDPVGRTLTERYVALSQPLEWPGARNARKRGVRASLRGAEAELEETKILLTAQVKQSFYHLLLAERRAELAEKTLSTTKNFSRAVNQRVTSGESAPFEAVKVKVEVLNAEKKVARATGLLRAARASLNTLTSGRLSQSYTIAGSFARPVLNVDEERLQKMALEKHPLIRRFQTQIEVATERHTEERHSIIPNVTVNGYYQRDAGREGFIGGLTVPLPLWNQRQGKIAQAMAIQHQAEAHLRQIKNTLQTGITEQVEISRAASAQIHTFEKGLLRQAKEAVRIAQVSFKFGEANLLEVLDAQRVLWHTLFSYAEAQHELSIALAELERLVGREL